MKDDNCLKRLAELEAERLDLWKALEESEAELSEIRRLLYSRDRAVESFTNFFKELNFYFRSFDKNSNVN